MKMLMLGGSLDNNYYYFDSLRSSCVGRCEMLGVVGLLASRNCGVGCLAQSSH